MERLLNDPEDPADKARFQQAWDREREALMERLRERAQELGGKFDTALTEFRLELIAGRHLELGLDLPQAFEEVWQMIRQVRNTNCGFLNASASASNFPRKGLMPSLQKPEGPGQCLVHLRKSVQRFRIRV